MKFVTGETLRNFNAPTGHMFEPGVYSLAQRGVTVGYKALQFGFIGFIAGLFGTACTNALITVRQVRRGGRKQGWLGSGDGWETVWARTPSSLAEWGRGAVLLPPPRRPRGPTGGEGGQVQGRRRR